MVIAIILAGGSGTRLAAEIPKQYIEVEGKKIIKYSMEPFFEANEVDYVKVVATNEWQRAIEEDIEDRYKKKFLGFSKPGDNRQLSIWNALEDIKQVVEEKTIVVIHDAARPLVSSKLISMGIETLKAHDGALPVLPMKDTVYYSEDGLAVSYLLDRKKVVAGQAPEFFDYKLYYEANEVLINASKIYEINGSTEPAVMAGMDVALITGEENNFKITTNTDLERFRQIVKERR